jgi:hypothetical protein
MSIAATTHFEVGKIAKMGKRNSKEPRFGLIVLSYNGFG